VADRVSLSWTESVDNATQVSVTLLRDGSPYFADMIGYREALVLDLSPSTTHTFQVTVRDYFGNSNASNVLSVTTPAATDTTAPTVPANLRLSFESSPPEIWLDWDQSTDAVDPQSQIGYQVFLNGELDHTVVGRGDTVTYCRGVGPNTITIRAVDASANASGFSNQLVFC